MERDNPLSSTMSDAAPAEEVPLGGINLDTSFEPISPSEVYGHGIPPPHSPPPTLPPPPAAPAAAAAAATVAPPPPPEYQSVHEHHSATYDQHRDEFLTSDGGWAPPPWGGGSNVELNSWQPGPHPLPGSTSAPPSATHQEQYRGGPLSSTQGPQDLDTATNFSASSSLINYPDIPTDGFTMGSLGVGVSPRAGGSYRIIVLVGSPIKLTGPSSLPGVVEYYMSYPVTTHTTLPGFSSPEITVRRRFKDFVALHDLMHLLHPGYIIPPRPKRNAVEGRRMQPAFIEDRRASLERYLNRLGTHPVISRSEALQVFLEYNGDLRHNADWLRLHPTTGFISGTAKLFRQMVGKERRTLLPSDITQPSGTDPLRSMRETVSSIQGVMKHAPVTPTERSLRDEGVTVDEVRLRLGHMSKCCEEWVFKSSEKQHALAELARALMYLSKYEETRGSSLFYTENSVSEACGQVSKVLAITIDQSAVHLGNVNDYLAYIPAVQSAFAHRERVNLTSITLELDLARARGRMDALLVAGPTHFEKRQRAEADVAQMESSLQTARSEYGHMCERNVEELAKWRVDMKTDLVAMFKEFVIVQIASDRKAQEIFETTVAALPS